LTNPNKEIFQKSGWGTAKVQLVKY